jgi:hypothetical protein
MVPIAWINRKFVLKASGLLGKDAVARIPL